MPRTHIYIVDAERESRLGLMRWATERGSLGRPFLTAADFICELPHLKHGIAFIDVQNLGRDGFDVVEAVAGAKLACPVIGMAQASDMVVAVAALKRGAVDFLVKPIALPALYEAAASAERIMEQRRVMVEQRERDRQALDRLSVHERLVLAALAMGKTSKAIAGENGISMRTVEGQRAALMEKLGTATTAAAITIAVRYETVLLADASLIHRASGGEGPSR